MAAHKRRKTRKRRLYVCLNVGIPLMLLITLLPDFEMKLRHGRKESIYVRVYEYIVKQKEIRTNE